jgi:predicted AlkP superfamily pyrophosphatase or phosphodiesterase
MKPSFAHLFAGCWLLLAAPALAQPSPPRLLVVISVDQFSADLFSQYRPYFTGGFQRLQQGAVFPKGYQSHAATETCPGHSTILTGNRPGHTGVIANSWYDQSISRPDKLVYCSEDPTLPGTTARDYVASTHYLRVPTLGGYMKAANPAAKVISVAGKDRAAIMMGGKTLDQIWWWGGTGFVSYKGVAPTPLVERVNAGVRAMLDQDRPAMDLPALCEARSRAIPASARLTVGDGRFARKAGDQRAFQMSPEYDAAVLALAASLIDDQRLGTGPATDLISIGLSATDYVGHGLGTQGAEMCLQLLTLDRELGAFLDRLDERGIDYLAALTADHGGLDLPERQREQAADDARRLDPALTPAQINARIAEKTGLSGPLIMAAVPFGDVYVNKALTAAERALVVREAKAIYLAQPQVETVFTHEEQLAAPEPSGPPESWSLLMMAKANFDPERSGDLLVLLKPRITPIVEAGPGYAATHGSPWDYDRRVPILFWRKGMMPFEQPLGVETVDIMPTLAAQIRLPLPPDRIDGKCLDLDSGPASSCPPRQAGVAIDNKQ